MEDNLSMKSSDSISNSDEYVFVNNSQISHSSSGEQPKLGIANNGDINDLCMDLKEVLSEMEPTQKPTQSKQIVEVGNSKFYDDNINNDESEYFEDVQQNCTKFNGVSYLGSAKIHAPKSEAEIQRNMAILYEQSSEQSIKISISVPSSSEGIVVLYDGITQQVMARYEIYRILFYARGKSDSPEASCFAFTWSHGESHESSSFQCHVFKCDIPEAVGLVSQCFAKAFQHPSTNMSPNGISSSVDDYAFEVTLEIKEENGKGGYATVPRDRNDFKIRVDLEKKLCLSVQQVSSNDRVLEIERCFGVLVSPGRNVKHSDMQLLEMVSMGSGSSEKQVCVISGQWDPTEAAFASLNSENLSRSYVTIAMDLVIKGIQEPVRFLIETSVKIFPKNERFWFVSSNRLVQQFFLQLREIEVETFEVISIETSGALDRSRLNLALNLQNFIRSPSITSIETITPQDQNSDNDEPLLSGTGEVSRFCSSEELEGWGDVLRKWVTNEGPPKQLKALVRGAIPDTLRGAVWQRLAGCDEDKTLMDKYRVLIAEDCPCESVIQRDINRTFPAHDFFKEAGGLGQDSLYRLSKAYAVYDKEVGYCQGLSFVAATLLLHMPEEQAFCVLVHMMYKYELRDMYKDGFDSLYMRLYQLNRLMEENLPELWQHLNKHSVESHMFASQWFLTVFTARFPLYLVFRILDLFLLQGIDTLFQIALALLMMCRKDLLQLDFENTLKYFRVTLPKKFRSKDMAQNLIKVACYNKVKKLKKFEHEFRALKEAQETADNFSSELDNMKSTLDRCEEEKHRLESELFQVKGMLKREVDRAEVDARRNSSIIAEYKKINSRLDSEQNLAKSRLTEIKNKVGQCESCSKLLEVVDVPSTNIENTRESSIKIVSSVREGDEDDKSSQLSRALERIRELELELAQTKLERVEAECWKQELTHQLNATLAELQTAKTSWIHKTFSTIKEVAVNKTMPDSGGGGSGFIDAPISTEGGELMKKVFASRVATKDKERDRESPRRSQTMETMSNMTNNR